MSPKRLFDGPRAEPGKLLIDLDSGNLPRHSRGLCGLAVCLQSALASASLSVSYPDLMGLLNAAFMLVVDDEFSVNAAIARRWQHLGDVLGDLGFTEWRIAARPPGPEAVVSELREGRSLLALGWGRAAGDWSLICGQSADGSTWLGYDFAADPLLQDAPAGCRLAVSIGKYSGSADITEARQLALQAAARLRSSDMDPIAAYAHWATLMKSRRPFPDGPIGDEMILRHEWFTEVLLDARSAAADFLSNVEPISDELAEDETTSAADLYRRVVDLLESRSPGLFDPLATEALRDAEVRDEWAELLEQAADTEAKALAILKRVARGGAS